MSAKRTEIHPRRHTARTRLRFGRLWQAIGWVMVAVVVFFSLIPHPPLPPGLLGFDKVQHVVAYAGLMYWFQQTFVPSWRWPAFFLFLGLMLEWLQGLSGLRTFDAHDMFANSTGVGVGWLLAKTPLGRLVEGIDGVLAGWSDRLHGRPCVVPAQPERGLDPPQ